MKPSIKIEVIDDDPIFLKLFCKQLDSFLGNVERAHNVKFQVDVYQHGLDAISHTDGSADWLFIDYYLDANLNAGDILRLKRIANPDLRAVIMSGDVDRIPSLDTLAKTPEDVLRKDKWLVPRSCVLIEQYLEHRQ